MQKRLKSSIREKKRYLLLNISDKKKIDSVILDFIGILGYGKSGIQHIKDKKIKSGHAVIAVNREKLDEIRAGMAFGSIKVLRVSGTLRGLLK